MNAKTQAGETETLERHAESEIMYETPETFAHRAEDGTIMQVRDPCYNLLAPGYYGDTWYDEGEIIITPICPNYQMQPLNRAAEKRVNEWLNSLPEQGVMITMEDTVEASHMLRNDPRVKDLSHDDFSKAVQRVAMGLKRKREEKGGLAIPQLGLHTMTAANSKAAPMPNMTYTDPSLRGPGQVGRSAVLHQPKRNDNTTRRGSPAMGAMPPQAR